MIYHVSNITACDGCSVWFTFNVTGLEECQTNLYKIVLYENITKKVLVPTQNSFSLYNATICNVNLTIESVPLYYNKFLFHVEIVLSRISYPSNDFRIIVQGQW